MTKINEGSLWRWTLFRAFWYGFFRPFNTEANRLDYAIKALEKLKRRVDSMNGGSQ